MERIYQSNSSFLTCRECNKTIKYGEWYYCDSNTMHVHCVDCGSFNEEKTNEPVKDNVNSPSHYTDGKIEVIDFIEDKKLNYHRGNAIKYISRAGKKNKDKEVEDLQKAIWYLNREISRLQKGDK